jgi:hypothetical protein
MLISNRIDAGCMQMTSHMHACACEWLTAAAQVSGSAIAAEVDTAATGSNQVHETTQRTTTSIPTIDAAPMGTAVSSAFVFAAVQYVLYYPTPATGCL